MNNDNILSELINNQRKNISKDKKLLFNDIKRLSKYFNRSIFINSNILSLDETNELNTIINNDCVLWLGNISNNNYINFYLNKKKNSLHRILYYNYINDIDDSEYIKFNCPNKGKCCNIYHFYKIDNKHLINKIDNIIYNKINNIIDNKKIINIIKF